MTSFAHPGTRGLSTVFGLMMVGSAAVGSHGLAVVVGLAAVIAVGVAAVFRLAATLAVVLSVVMIVVSGPTHVLAALSGLLRRRLPGVPIRGRCCRRELADDRCRRWFHVRWVGCDVVPAASAMAAVGGTVGRVGYLRAGHPSVLEVNRRLAGRAGARC